MAKLPEDVGVAMKAAAECRELDLLRAHTSGWSFGLSLLTRIRSGGALEGPLVWLTLRWRGRGRSHLVARPQVRRKLEAVCAAGVWMTGEELPVCHCTNGYSTADDVIYGLSAAGPGKGQRLTHRWARTRPVCYSPLAAPERRA